MARQIERWQVEKQNLPPRSAMSLCTFASNPSQSRCRPILTRTGSASSCIAGRCRSNHYVSRMDRLIGRAKEQINHMDRLIGRAKGQINRIDRLICRAKEQINHMHRLIGRAKE